MTIKLPDAPPLVPVTVNGQAMELPKGKNLLQALLDLGHYVPHYCYHPSLTVAGNCRLCLIEIVGRPKPEISCNMVVTENLNINTEGPLVESCRKGMMEFLLINHPLDCPVCDRGGECMLQRYSMDFGWGTARTTDVRRRFKKPQFDPLIDIERNRCIMCTRCVRFCDEVAGDHVMGVFGHGNRNYIGTFGNGPVSNPYSGNVIDLCPVGCLTSKPFRFKARPWEMRQTLTTTRFCNGAVTAWTRGTKLLRTTPPVRRRYMGYTLDEDTVHFISNEARFGTMYTNNPERLLEPRVRRTDAPVKASWEVALDVTAAALRDCAPGEAAFIAGERSTNEEFFQLARLARTVANTPYIDWRSRFTSEAAAQAAGVALAAGDGDFDLLERKGYQATLVINSQLLETAPDIALPIKEAARLGRTRLGLIDSHIEPWLAEHAAMVYLEQPGDLAGVIDQVTGAVGAQGSGQAREGYEPLAEFLKAEQGLVVLGLDASGGALNPALVPAVLRLMQALGEKWHFLPVTAARNARGALGCGAQSDRLPTGALADEKARERAGHIWPGATLNGAGETPAAPAILQMAAEGKFKTLFIHRADELVTHPQRALIEQAIRMTPNVIVVDVFPSWITERATVVLPGTVFYETDGSMTDIDGTLQRMSQGQRPPAGAQEEWRILEAISERLGAAKRYRTGKDVFADLVRAWDAPKTFRLDDLLLEGPGKMSPQVWRPSYGTRTRPNFKLSYGERGTIPTYETPTHVAAGGLRLVFIHHSQGLDHLGSRSSVFDELRPQPKLELHPEDAQAAGLTEGDWVLLEGGVDRGATRPSQIRFNPYMARGYAFGASNVLGLRIGAEESGFPAITLRKSEAPSPGAVEIEAEELLEA